MTKSARIVLAALACIAGVVSAQDWLCQQEGSCSYAPGICPGQAPACPPSTCNAAQANYGGTLLQLDVSSHFYNGGPNHPARVTTARQCCAACAAQAGCNTWTFCSKSEGCGSGCTNDKYGFVYVAGAPDDPMRFGQFSSCRAGDKFPFGMCSLKFNANPASPEVYETGASQDWTSGTLTSVTALAPPPPTSPPPPPPQAPCYSEYNMSANGVTLVADTGAVHVTAANFQGEILVLDTNSWPEYAVATSVYDCGKLCRQNGQCNVFTFCNSYNEPNSGCGNPGDCDPGKYGYTSASPTNKTRFGPKGGCLSDGRWPRNLCSLKRYADPANPVSVGPTGYDRQHWMSGSFTPSIPNLCPKTYGSRRVLK